VPLLLAEPLKEQSEFRLISRTSDLAEASFAEIRLLQVRMNPRFRAAQSVAHMLARREGKTVTQALSIVNHQLSLWGTACYDVRAHDVHLCNMMLISHALLIGTGEMLQQSPRAFRIACSLSRIIIMFAQTCYSLAVSTVSAASCAASLDDLFLPCICSARAWSR